MSTIRGLIQYSNVPKKRTLGSAGELYLMQTFTPIGSIPELKMSPINSEIEMCFKPSPCNTTTCTQFVELSELLLCMISKCNARAHPSRLKVTNWYAKIGFCLCCPQMIHRGIYFLSKEFALHKIYGLIYIIIRMKHPVTNQLLLLKPCISVISDDQ